jgi:glutathione synthase/RimK-type ligase-like ATP-grasp enzyme
MKNKILIITSSFDKTVDYIINKFDHDKFIRLNVDELHSSLISITNQNGFKIVLQNKLFNIQNLFHEIHAIYYRKLFLPKLDDYEDKYHVYMQKEIYSFITGIVDSFEGKILTTPSILRKVENKIFQFSIAMKLNFLLPNSLITNCAKKANRFNDHNIIGKPLATGKLTLTTTTGSNIIRHKIENINLSPIYFQSYIPKDYELRVTVIGDKFYCVKIIADNKIDWRQSSDTNQYELISTPLIVKEQCQNFMKVCNLNFGAFDYIVYNNEYYFLECNPNGQWLWLELALKLDISTTLVKFLDE